MESWVWCWNSLVKIFVNSISCRLNHCSYYNVNFISSIEINLPVLYSKFKIELLSTHSFANKRVWPNIGIGQICLTTWMRHATDCAQNFCTVKLHAIHHSNLHKIRNLEWNNLFGHEKCPQKNSSAYFSLKIRNKWLKWKLHL